MGSELATALGAQPKQVGEYWLALLRDVISVRQGTSPRHLKNLERDRPIRPSSADPRSPLIIRLFDQARQLTPDGPLATQSVLEALLSFSPEERRLLVQAARHVPLPVPTPPKKPATK